MKVKEFAELFGMTVSELSESTGYSRQALYNIIEGNAIVNTRRYNAMLKKLKTDAWQHMCAEQSRVQKEYERKIAVLEELDNRERSYPGTERVSV